MIKILFAGNFYLVFYVLSFLYFELNVKLNNLKWAPVL
jgi:hypothetical protein